MTWLALFSAADLTAAAAAAEEAGAGGVLVVLILLYNCSPTTSWSRSSSFPRKRSAAAETGGIELVSMPKNKKSGKSGKVQRNCIFCMILN